MRNLYPLAFITGPIFGYLLYLAIVWYPLGEWLFFTAAAIMLMITFVTFCWIEVQDLPEPFTPF